MTAMARRAIARDLPVHDRLEEFRRRAMDWTRRNRRSFCLTPGASPNIFVAQLKPVAELLLTVELVGRNVRERRAGSTAARFASEMGAHAMRELGDGSALLQLLRDSPDLIAGCSLYAAARSFGFWSGEIERVLRALASTRWLTALELPPWRALDVARSLRSLGICSKLRPRSVLHRTWLGRMPEPWLISEGSAYSVTHTAFYVTDFGRQPQALPRRLRDYLRRWLGPWAAAFAGRRNFDLLAELLMVAECLADREDLDDLWEALLGAQSVSGLVEGPPVYSDTIDKKVIPRGHRTFVRHYHTTLVSIIAATMALAYGRSLRVG